MMQNVQTANKVNAVSRINRNEHGRQLLHVALESRIDPMNPITHPAGCFEHLIWSNSPTKRQFDVDRAMEIGCGQLKQFEESWPGSYIVGCIRAFGQLADQQTEL